MARRREGNVAGRRKLSCGERALGAGVWPVQPVFRTGLEGRYRMIGALVAWGICAWGNIEEIELNAVIDAVRCLGSVYYWLFYFHSILRAERAAFYHDSRMNIEATP